MEMMKYLEVKSMKQNQKNRQSNSIRKQISKTEDCTIDSISSRLVCEQGSSPILIKSSSAILKNSWIISVKWIQSTGGGGEKKGMDGNVVGIVGILLGIGGKLSFGITVGIVGKLGSGGRAAG
ncbi:uncharacterized protein [Euphorbia lathyris]|uniref:uncharacterized protein n=1 Tax=Euphorbia lathyris TaxID=212925 RepID=UPI0033138780